MTNPLVSVVTPSFNQGHFIGETIQSVLGQDYPHIELIVMDGGSTDNTVDVLRGVQDARLTWVSEKDRGQSDAINKGMRRAKGDILTYLNSDDLLLPGAVRFTVDYFNANPNVPAIFGDAYLIDVAGKPFGDFKARPFSVSSAITGGQPNPQQGTFWRRSVMDAIGLFDESLHYCMDYEYWIRMGLAGYELRYVPGLRGAYRFHETSKTVSQLQKFIADMTRVIDAVYARTDLPADVIAQRDQAYAYLAWWTVKDLYMQRQYGELRPRLRPFLRGGRRGRQALASLMYLDTALHTRLAHWFSEMYFRVMGRKPLLDG